MNNDIKGLTYIPHFISNDEETLLLEKINAQSWNTSLKRLTQHYGYEYKYTGYTLNPASPIPDFILPIKERIEKITGNTYDMVIVNRYLPKEGISPHIDHIKLFGSSVVSLSLGSNAIMKFEKDNLSKNLLLEKCSLAILQEDARYKWKHSIPSVKEMRISITFRNIIKKD